MRYKLHPEVVSVTCTYEEVFAMERDGQFFYATLGPDDYIQEVYISEAKRSAEDICVATPDEFAEEKKWDLDPWGVQANGGNRKARGTIGVIRKHLRLRNDDVH